MTSLFFVAAVIYSFIKPAPVKLDNLELLEGQNNYEDWASQASIKSLTSVYSPHNSKKTSQWWALWKGLMDDQWTRVYQGLIHIARNSVHSDYAKRDFLLAALNKHYIPQSPSVGMCLTPLCLLQHILTAQHVRDDTRVT